MLTQAELKSTFNYDQSTGLFTRIHSTTRTDAIGKVAGYVQNDGYRAIKIHKKLYKAHRLAWLYVYGNFPDSFIDHIDGNKDNNKITNLREASNIENQYNSKLSVKNTSGFKNIFFNKKNNRWKILISINGKQCYFGSYIDKDVAINKAQEIRSKHHREFANHG